MARPHSRRTFRRPCQWSRASAFNRGRTPKIFGPAEADCASAHRVTPTEKRDTFSNVSRNLRVSKPMRYGTTSLGLPSNNDRTPPSSAKVRKLRVTLVQISICPVPDPRKGVVKAGDLESALTGSPSRRSVAIRELVDRGLLVQDERGPRFYRVSLARGPLAPFVIRQLDALGYLPRILKDDAPGGDARSR